MIEANSCDANGDSFGIPADPELTAEGWVRRHLVDHSRAQQSVDLYASMGFEVIARKLEPSDLGSACGSCGEAVCGSYVLIYTRKPDVDRAGGD